MDSRRAVYWLGLGVTAFIFGSAGAMKAFGAAEMHHNMVAINYPSWFTFLLGGGELLCVLGLFFQRTRLWVMAIFQAILFGGIGSHIAAGHGLDRLSFALLGVMALAILWFFMPKGK
jgi:hypothetical protein